MIMKKTIRATVLSLLLFSQSQLQAQIEKTTTMQQTVIQLHRTIMKAVKEKNGAPLHESLKNDFIFTSAPIIHSGGVSLLVVVAETTQYICFKIGFLVYPKHIIYLQEVFGKVMQ